MDADFLHILDDADKKLYRYARTGGTETASKTLREAGGGDLGSPRGITIDRPDVWVVDINRDEAYRYNLASLFLGSGDQNASEQHGPFSDNRDVNGIAVENIATINKHGGGVPKTILDIPGRLAAGRQS